MAFSATSVFLCDARLASAGTSFIKGPVITAWFKAFTLLARRVLGMFEAHESSRANVSVSVALCDKLSSAPHFRNKSSAQ
jgi:hypothetical protein